MKTKFIQLATVVLFTLLSQNSSALYFDWGRFYDGLSNDKTLNVIRNDAGQFCITATTDLTGGQRLIKRCYDGAGNLMSSKLSDIVLPGPVLFIAQDDNPNTYVVCSVSGDTVLMKFNPALKHKWSSTAAGTVANLRLTTSGDPVIGGVKTTGLYAAKYKQGNGSLRFQYNHTSGFEANDVVIDASGNIYIGGNVPEHETDMNIVKLNSAGALVWAITYGEGLLGGRDQVYKLAIDPSQNVYVFGEIYGFGLTTANISATKFNSAGVHQWNRHVATAGGCCGARAQFILFDPAWNPIFIGVRYDFYNVSPSNETSRIFVNKLDRSTGAVIYFTHPDDIPYTSTTIDESLECAITGGASGDIYIGGTNNVGALLGDHKWFVTRVSQATGLRSWSEAGYDVSTNENKVNAIVLDADSVYVGLTEFNGSNLDIGLEKFIQLGFPTKLRADEPDQINPSIVFGSTNVFPNPFSYSFTLFQNLNVNGELIFIRVFDFTGKLVEERTTSEAVIELGAKWTTGMYILDVISNNHRQTFKVVKSN